MKYSNIAVIYNNGELDIGELERDWNDLRNFRTDLRNIKGKTAKEKYRLSTGIARATCLWDIATFKALFPFIAPEESMHTLFLNVIPQLVDLSCGKYFADLYLISPQTYAEMGHSLVQNQKMFPLEFGERIPDINIERKEYQASTWYTYGMLLMPIQFLDRLDIAHRGPWSQFFWAVQSVHGHILEKDEVLTIHDCFLNFTQYLER
jgi:hypothetical protein